MYKISNSLSPEIMKDVFKTKTNFYNTFTAVIFSKRDVETDMDYRPCLTWVLRPGTLYSKR